VAKRNGPSTWHVLGLVGKVPCVPWAILKTRLTRLS
jgi:hypothetical protein